MNINILGFGIAREIFGARQVSLSIVEGATVGDVKIILEKEYPRLGQLATYMVAVNNEYASNTKPILKATDEIAIIPPVSGG